MRKTNLRAVDDGTITAAQKSDRPTIAGNDRGVTRDEAVVASPARKKISARCSSLPLIVNCAASADAEVFSIDTSGEPASLGNGVHEWLAVRISMHPARTRIPGHPDRSFDIDRIASKYNVDPSELSRLCGWAWRAWLELSGWFPNPQCEVEFSCTDGENGITLSGHLDVLSVVGTTGRILDHKTGRLDEDSKQQLMGYGFLLLDSNYQLENVYACVLRARDQMREAWQWSRAELDEWYVDFVKHIHKGRYSAGRWCDHCPRGLDCTAKTKLLAQSVGAITEFNGVLPTEVGARGLMLGTLLDRIKLVESATKKAREMIRADVANHGGSMPAGDGRALVITEQVNRSIDYELGKPILEEEIPDAWPKCVRVSKGDVEEAVKANAPRGMKGKAVVRALRRLDEAGAIVSTTIEKLEIKRVAVERPALEGAIG